MREGTGELMPSATYTVAPSDSPQRLDLFVSEKAGITRSQAQILIEDGLVTVSGRKEKSNYKVRPHDEISIVKREAEPEILIPEQVPLEVLYLDDYLAVVNKPAGMVVYPSSGHPRGTLLNALASRTRKMATVGGPLRPGVVHRLDKDTSGVMVVALDDTAYYHLVEQFGQRTINRRYIALVYGDLKGSSGEIALDIGRSVSDRKKMSTRTRRGKEAVTRWKVMKRFGVAALIEAKLGTGRTHQIRVHFSAIGHPVLGDTTYGRKTSVEMHRRKITFPRQMLHAETLGFTHPATGEHMEFSSPLPEDLKKCIEEFSGA